jgi:hypothetical protein
MKPDYIEIENNPGLLRHVNSMGIINTDLQARNRYLIQKKKIMEEKQLLSGALYEVSNLRKELDGLKKIVELCLMREPLNS